ncbi:hypothetical protein PVAND_014636 [Polypedilum vanderplanki]|uniref:Uncharacterized protein n=1 Tax=Polypedilum vanderplanki TaxID=319348 RepID=A0A9J6B9Y6_POLVA|nr:hypothetical protein PVAND_014636 [Polypedilum vanderplanki]
MMKFSTLSLFIFGILATFPSLSESASYAGDDLHTMCFPCHYGQSKICSLVCEQGRFNRRFLPSCDYGSGYEC